MSLNWNSVLSEIRFDFKKFLEEGGWAFLRDDKSDSEGEESEEDSAFTVSPDEGEESSDENFSDEEEEDEMTSEFSDEEISDDFSWDEQERRAAEADKKHIQKQQQKKGYNEK